MDIQDRRKAPEESVAATIAAFAAEPPARPRFTAAPILWGALGFAALAGVFYMLA